MVVFYFQVVACHDVFGECHIEKKPPEKMNPPGWLFLLCMHNDFFILKFSLYFPVGQSSFFLYKLLKIEVQGNASPQG